MDGETEVKLSEIQKTLGLEGLVFDASFSDPELVSFTRDVDGNDWTVGALKAFDTEENLILTIDGKIYEIKVTDDATVSYHYIEDGLSKEVTGPVDATLVTESDENWGTSGVTSYYVVNSDTELSKRPTVTGTVVLILADGVTLTASKGITVSEENTLMITTGNTSGTIVGSGALTATGGVRKIAGIGSLEDGASGTIIINGGTVTANGGQFGAGGAGIGGGNNGNGGTITINGGTVTANGGLHAAGIGGGDNGNGGTITINGGTVTANGGFPSGVGIGGGMFADGGTITINGGIVTATGDNGAAGIGSGEEAPNGSKITINGGVVTAQGGDGAAGIGAYRGCVGQITISGGMVKAIGGDTAEGIGGTTGPSGTLEVIGDSAVVIVKGDSNRAIYCENITATPSEKSVIIEYDDEKYGGKSKTSVNLCKFSDDELDIRDYIQNVKIYFGYTYAVKYEANGGTESMSDQTIIVDDETALTANSFIRNGYTFKGWALESDKNTVKYANKEKVTNIADGGETITLYAVWEKNATADSNENDSNNGNTGGSNDSNANDSNGSSTGASNTTTENAGSTTTSSPKTGDVSQMFLWTLRMLVCAGMLAGIVTRRKREER